MPLAKTRASTILTEFDQAQAELVGKAVILTDGKAGTVDNIWLDALARHSNFDQRPRRQVADLYDQVGADRLIAAGAWRGNRSFAESHEHEDKRDGLHQVYDFLTTEAKAVVAPIHPKAMPVILTTDEETRCLDARAMG
jgi:hypothetical protein